MDSVRRVKCKSCGVEKAKIKAKRRIRAGGKLHGWIYKDETGKLWQGTICRPCFTQKGASHPKDDSVYKPILRNCRKCGIKTVNYYKCTHCWSGSLEHYFDPVDAYGYHNTGEYSSGW